ncbi:MAG: lysylphosphatidylglycerol synthase transmembrane domain-containing protein, partial [Chloroflexota bacterium]|nr:lysylphosphatidylglycerol synthase transmembrane domain-containing protein [Chloroflexota bacterium]
MAIPRKAPRALGQAAAALVGLALGAGLGYLAVRGVDWGGVAEALRSVQASAIAPAVGVVLLSAWVRAWRWRVTFAHIPVRVFRLFQVENAALGVNNLSPVRIGGEVVSLAILALRDRVAAGAVVATIIMVRSLDLIFTLLFIGVSILSAPELTDLARPVAFVSVLAFVALVGVLNLRFIVRRVPALARLPGVASFEEAIAELWADRPRLTFTFGLTATYWLMLGPAAFLLGRSMG